MKALYDANVWIALTFPSHSHHKQATEIYEKASETIPACFTRATQLSYLRLVTTPALLKAYGADGITNRHAIKMFDTLIQRPQIEFLEEPFEMAALWSQLASLKTASPKIWMDAYLAAFAILSRINLVTLDRDFVRFKKHGLQLTQL